MSKGKGFYEFWAEGFERLEYYMRSAELFGCPIEVEFKGWDTTKYTNGEFDPNKKAEPKWRIVVWTDKFLGMAAQGST